MDKFEFESFTKFRDVVEDLQSCFIDVCGENYARTPSLSEWMRASRLTHRLTLMTMELYGYASASRQFQTFTLRQGFNSNVAKGVESEENEKESGHSKKLKFTKKEILAMPIQYHNLFFTENVVAHIRLCKGKYHEIRCQLDGKKITATNKNLETAKKRFIEKLHEHANPPKQEEPIEEEPPFVSFYDYGQEWLDTVKRPIVKENTFADYQSIFDVHLFPAFGHLELCAITRQEIQTYFNELIEKGKSRSAHKQRQLLTSLFEYAEIDELITRSPMKKITLPIHESENGKSLTVDEEKIFVERCLQSETLSGKAFVFILYTGLRRAELSTATVTGEFVTVISAKQRKGKTIRTRKIPISPRLKKLLPNLESEINDFKGLYLNRLGRTFKEWLPNHHLHELRHTFITRAQECGIAREIVSVWAGHKADNTMTSNVYTHFSEEFQLQEIKKFDY